MNEIKHNRYEKCKLGLPDYDLNEYEEGDDDNNLDTTTRSTTTTTTSTTGLHSVQEPILPLTTHFQLQHWRYIA
jgi:hypothetical protein